MYSETCTPAWLPVEDEKKFGTLATLATFAGPSSRLQAVTEALVGVFKNKTARLGPCRPA